MAATGAADNRKAVADMAVDKRAVAPVVKLAKTDPLYVRERAFWLYSQWMAGWDQWTTPGEMYGDLMEYSPWEWEDGDGNKTGKLAYSREEHCDHVLWTFFPSVGDEAGYWTLYVVTDDYVDLKKPPFMITAMWLVFDTMPDAVYQCEWEYPPSSEGRGRNVGRWVKVPEYNRAIV